MRAAFAAVLLAACSQSMPAEDRPKVDILTGLPLFFGEGEIGDVLGGTASRSPLLDALERDWTLQPLDVARRPQLAQVDRLLIIQPQALAPDELVEIDRWVRRGGRLLILADPDLRWPSTLPSGDPRRPPPASLLSPLFTHWGVTLLPTTGLSPVAEDLEGRNVVFDSPGRWEVKGEKCAPASLRVLKCSIGKGEAILVSDVDFANPLWATATNGRNYAALDALMARVWPKDGQPDAEQNKYKPPG